MHSELVTKIVEISCTGGCRITFSALHICGSYQLTIHLQYEEDSFSLDNRITFMKLTLVFEAWASYCDASLLDSRFAPF